MAEQRVYHFFSLSQLIFAITLGFLELDCSRSILNTGSLQENTHEQTSELPAKWPSGLTTRFNENVPLHYSEIVTHFTSQGMQNKTNSF